MKKKHYIILILTILLGFSANAQRTVSGTVKSAADGESFAGAVIQLVGTNIGTKTNSDGDFTIQVPEANKNGKLKVSYIGYKTNFVAITSDKLTISLSEDKLKVDEVVVTALSIKRDKRSLGYSTSIVSGDNITQAGASSTLTGIQGKVTGANISNNGGTPGSSTSILLRGPKSFTGNNQALIVVDGVPINNSSFQNSDNLNNSVDFGNRLNDINPNDIESLTVLKGAEGAALYGSLAANGVVIITTKSAKKGSKKTKDVNITFNSNLQLQNPLVLPELQSSFGQGAYGNYDSRENWSWGAPLDGIKRPWGNAIVDADGVSRIRVKPFTAISDNLRNGFNTGSIFTNDVSVSKAFDKFDFYFSYQNTAQKGIVPNTGLDKNSLRLNLGLDVLDNLKVNMNINYVNSKIKNSIQGQANTSFYNNLLQIPVDIPIEELKDYNNPYNNITNYYGAYTFNPFLMVDYNNANNIVNRINTSTTITYNPVKWLTITERLGFDNYTDSRYIRSNKFTNTNQNPNIGSEIGNYSEDIRQNTLVNNDLMILSKRSITPDLEMTGMVGFNIYSDNLKRTLSSTAGLAIPNYYNLSNSDGRPTNSNTEFWRLKYGFYGDFGVSYKNYFFVNITGRQDWSSTLPAEKRSYFYPGISSSFVFTELWKDDFITFGKLRASWTQIGNDAPNYSLSTVYNAAGVSDGFNNSSVISPFIGSDGSTQVPGFSQSNLAGNPTLRPEIISTWEIGADLGLLKDRIGVDFALYKSTTTDGIIQVDVAPSSGFTSRYVNAGKMENFGYEINLRATPILSKKIKVDAFMNFTQNENKVIEVMPGIQRLSLGGLSGASNYVDAGSPYGVFFANGYQRSPDGRIVADATTGLPILNGQLVKMGSYLPKYQIGFGANITINKRLRASILFDYKKGGVLYSRTKDLVEFLGSGVTTTINNREDYVIPNTVNLVNGQYEENTTAVSVQDWMTQQSDGENNIIDASYFKLREASISYSFPISEKFSKFVKSIDISIFGNNLAVWLPSVNKYVDPEINSFGTGNVQGIDFSNIPSVRSIGANFKLTF
jgi:TonB-linked SusC/RagA family outer membrane protein